MCPAMSSYLDGRDTDSEPETDAVVLSEEERSKVLESVQQLKTEANQYFTGGDHEKALEIYTSALNILKCNNLEKDSIILLNRSAAYLALKRFVPALNDANQAIELDPSNWKGHWRKGLALMSMSKRLFRTKEAVAAFESCRACSSLPTNKYSEVDAEIRKARTRLEQQEAESPPPDLSKCVPS